MTHDEKMKVAGILVLTKAITFQMTQPFNDSQFGTVHILGRARYELADELGIPYGHFVASGESAFGYSATLQDQY